MFVADEIPASLQRIIEFLNSQMVDTEVLGLEIKQYVSSNKQRTLVPKLIGKTAAAVQVKKTNNFIWTEEIYLEQVEKVSGEAGRIVCEKLLQDFKSLGCKIRWGKGLVQGGFTVSSCGNHAHRLCSVYFHKHDTKVEMPFSEYIPPYNDGEYKKSLIAKLNAIEGCNIPSNPLRPSFDCRLLIDGSAYDRFIAIIKDMVNDINSYEAQAENSFSAN